MVLTGLNEVRLTGTFQSAEHAFQAAKYLYLMGGPRVDLAERFALEGAYSSLEGAYSSLEGAYSSLEGAAVLSKGRKKAMEIEKVKLNVSAWDKAMPGIMKTCIEARAAVDPDFVQACKILVDRGLRIRHLIRSKVYRAKDGTLVGEREDKVGPVLESIGRRVKP